MRSKDCFFSPCPENLCLFLFTNLPTTTKDIQNTKNKDKNKYNFFTRFLGHKLNPSLVNKIVWKKRLTKTYKHIRDESE